jgi:hypothetical protein
MSFRGEGLVYSESGGGRYVENRARDKLRI